MEPSKLIRSYGPRAIWLGLGIWAVLNLLQAFFTELFHDEAYYWMFSRNLAWGYAEHAPMVALVIRLGSSILPGEIGVRLIVVLMNVGTIGLVYLMSDRKYPLLLAALLFCMVEVQVAGFLAVPDAPLVFFVCLFLYRYKRWLENESWLNTLWLTLACVGVVYSKYHGLMVLFFTLLSNLSLLRKKQFWTMAIGATILYLPHLSWLVELEFATFRYHLLERIREPMPLQNFGNYLLTQLAVAGPFMGFLLFPAAFRYQTENAFQRTLKFVLYGVLGVLLLLSFRTNIEANWSASAFIPLVLLAYYFIAQQANWQKWVQRLAIPSVILFLFLRLYLTVDFLPVLRNLRSEFHHWPEWAAEIESVAGDRPVVFINSYQHPSKYTFYTGKLAYSLNTFMYHRTQYDQWPHLEDSLQDREICLISRGAFMHCDTLETSINQNVYYRNLSDFQSFNRIDIEVDNVPEQIVSGDSLNLSIRLVNRYGYPVEIKERPEFPVQISYHLFKYNRRVYDGRVKAPLLSGRTINETLALDIPVKLEAEPGEYHLVVSMVAGWLYGSFNGSFLPVEMVEVESGRED